jgi:hypothetical protein
MRAARTECSAEEEPTANSECKVIENSGHSFFGDAAKITMKVAVTALEIAAFVGIASVMRNALTPFNL